MPRTKQWAVSPTQANNVVEWEDLDPILKVKLVKQYTRTAYPIGVIQPSWLGEVQSIIDLPRPPIHNIQGAAQLAAERKTRLEDLKGVKSFWTEFWYWWHGQPSCAMMVEVGNILGDTKEPSAYLGKYKLPHKSLVQVPWWASM
jgi:hypothetical protein